MSGKFALISYATTRRRRTAVLPVSADDGLDAVAPVAPAGPATKPMWGLSGRGGSRAEDGPDSAALEAKSAATEEDFGAMRKTQRVTLSHEVAIKYASSHAETVCPSECLESTDEDASSSADELAPQVLCSKEGEWAIRLVPPADHPGAVPQPQDSDLDGHWVLSSKEPYIRSWLKRFIISGDIAIDGVGAECTIVHSRDGPLLCGGLLHRQGCRLLRKGKSGQVQEYRRKGKFLVV